MSVCNTPTAIREDLWPAFAAAAIAFCAEAAHTLLYIPLLQAYLPSHLHSTPALPGYALAAFATTRLLLQAPAGRLVDRIGTRPGAVGGLLILLLAGILFTIVTLPLFALAVSALYGLGVALVWPSIFSAVAGRYGERLHGRLAAAIQVAEAAGVGVGVGIGAVIVDRSGYGASFALYLGLIVIALLVSLLPRHGERTRRPIPSPLPRDRTPEAPRPTLTAGLLRLTAIGALLTFAPNLLAPIVRAYAVQELGLPLHDLILPLLPAGGIGLLAMLLSGAVSDKLGREPVTLAGLAAGAVGLWLLGGIHTLQFAIPVVTLAAGGYLITQPAWSAAVFDASTSQRRGTQFGMLMVVQGLAESMAPAIGGKLSELAGPGAAFRLAAVALTLAVPLTVAEALQRPARRRSRA